MKELKSQKHELVQSFERLKVKVHEFKYIWLKSNKDQQQEHFVEFMIDQEVLLKSKKKCFKILKNLYLKRKNKKNVRNSK